jgi:glycosyltransferase involved in cell wall biosynthesis
MDYSTTKTTFNMLREKLFWSSADRILTVSDAILNDLVDSYGFNRNHIRVVYNGVDTETFRPLEKNDPPDIVQNLAGKKVVLYVGHFGLRKGIFYLIRAMKIIKKSIPDSHLLCVGGAPSWLGKQNYWEYLKKEAASNEVEKEITLLNAVKYQQLVQYYSFARLVALPSYYESFSKVAVEAMACGKPVVATRSGGLPEVVEDGVSGILFRYGSIKDLADAIIHLLGDEKVAGDMGRRGRLRAEKLFTWHAVAERIKAVYSELESQNRNLQ